MKLAASRLLFFDRAIGRRLYLIVLIMAPGLLGILAITAVEVRESLFAAKEAETRHLVETAYSLVADYQRRAAQGEISEAAARQEALNRLSRLGYEQDQYFWVNDMAGKMLMHPIPQLVGTKVLDMRDAGGGYPFRDMIAVVSRQGAGLALYYRPPDASARLKQSYVRGVSGWNWIIGSGVFIDDVQAAIRRVVLRFGAATGVTLAVAILLVAVVGRGITRPVTSLTGMMRQLAAGHLTAEVPAQGRRDELGAMAAAVVVFKDSMVAAERPTRDAQRQRMREATQVAGWRTCRQPALTCVTPRRLSPAQAARFRSKAWQRRCRSSFAASTTEVPCMWNSKRMKPSGRRFTRCWTSCSSAAWLEA